MVVIASGSDSYVLCELAGTTYALRSDDIEQLEMVGRLTPVPNAPPFVEGVTSVRGRVIPAVSLRARFGFERAEHNLSSRYLRGMAHLGERLVLILDVPELLRGNDAPASIPLDLLPSPA